MKPKRKAFTLVELLVVIGIIALLVGLVLPGLNMARTYAREASVKATFQSLGTGLDVFLDDHGFYPPSSVREDDSDNECALAVADDDGDTSKIDVGAHRLAEAMLGIDQLGYSTHIVNELNYYKTIDTVGSDDFGAPCDDDTPPNPIERFGPYISTDQLKIGTMADVQAPSEPADESAEHAKAWNNTNPVILDAFTKKHPILYYRAKKSARRLTDEHGVNKGIFKYKDNEYITDLYGMHDTSTKKVDDEGPWKRFPYYIWDQNTGVGADNDAKFISSAARPYRSDSFILISAGADGEYGGITEDDICNFTRR